MLEKRVLRRMPVRVASTPVSSFWMVARSSGERSVGEVWVFSGAVWVVAWAGILAGLVSATGVFSSNLFWVVAISSVSRGGSAWGVSVGSVMMSEISDLVNGSSMTGASAVLWK